MIRKPETDWRRESASITNLRYAATGTVAVAKTASYVVRGTILWGFALLWGFAALAAGLFAGNLPMLVFVGALAAFTAWRGTRMLKRASGSTEPRRRF